MRGVKPSPHVGSHAIAPIGMHITDPQMNVGQDVSLNKASPHDGKDAP